MWVAIAELITIHTHSLKKLVFSEKTETLDSHNRTHYGRIAFAEYKMAPLVFHWVGAC